MKVQEVNKAVNEVIMYLIALFLWNINNDIDKYSIEYYNFNKGFYILIINMLWEVEI